jgi:hypothetical protein
VIYFWGVLFFSINKLFLVWILLNIMLIMQYLLLHEDLLAKLLDDDLELLHICDSTKRVAHHVRDAAHI